MVLRLSSDMALELFEEHSSFFQPEEHHPFIRSDNSTLLRWMLGDRHRKVITHYLKNLQEICVNLQVVLLTHSYSFFPGLQPF